MHARTDLFQNDFPPEEFAARKGQLFDLIGREACALLQGAGPVLRSEMFRQTNEFDCRCGVALAQAYLLLDGRAPRHCSCRILNDVYVKR